MNPKIPCTISGKCCLMTERDARYRTDPVQMEAMWVTDMQVMAIAARAGIAVSMPCSSRVVRLYRQGAVLRMREDGERYYSDIPYDNRDLVDLFCAEVMPLFGLEYFHDYKNTLQLYG